MSADALKAIAAQLDTDVQSLIAQNGNNSQLQTDVDAVTATLGTLDSAVQAALNPAPPVPAPTSASSSSNATGATGVTPAPTVVPFKA